MKAIVWTKYGPPEGLQLKEVAKPIPKDNEVLIRVHAATVTAGDCELRGLKLPPSLSIPMRLYMGLLRPKRITILGQEFAGEIEAIGDAVTRFQIGDQVFAQAGFRMGTYAEYICRPEEPKGMAGLLVSKPANMTYEEAAAVPTGGLEALHYVREANIQRGQKVLINGAGGSIGTMGVQLAKHLGAEVTAVDSTGKLGMLRSIGADHVIDYTMEDFTVNGETYDVIFDVVGKTSLALGMKSLSNSGIYLMANPRVSKMIRGRWASRGTNKRIAFGNVVYSTERLNYLKRLIEEGELRVVIDRTYPLEQVAEAHRYVETGRKAGNVVITVAHSDEARNIEGV